VAADYVHQVSTDESRHIRRFTIWAAILTAATALTFFLFIIFADMWLKQISHSAERRFIQPYVEFFSSDEPPDAEQLRWDSWLQGIADRVVESQGLPDDAVITIHYLPDDSVNAFATLGGHVFVFRGLIESLPDENSLAMVLAHEIAHVKNRDPIVSVGRAVAIQIFLSGVADVHNSPETVTDFGGDVVMGAYSRDQELAADDLALLSLYDVYGHAAGALAFFEWSAVEEAAVRDALDEAGLDDVDTLLGWLSTHPDSQDRLQRLSDQIAANGGQQRESVPYPGWVLEALLPEERDADFAVNEKGGESVDPAAL